MKGKSTAFQEFGEKHKGQIYRVYLSVNGCEYRLFSKRGKHDYLKNYSNYKDLLGKIFGNFPLTAAQPFDFENPYSFIGHLYIVLYEESLEESISELYMKHCKNRILYVANHRRCSEIVFDIRKKNRILQATYRLPESTTKWKAKKKS